MSGLNLVKQERRWQDHNVRQKVLSETYVHVLMKMKENSFHGTKVLLRRTVALCLSVFVKTHAIQHRLIRLLFNSITWRSYVFCTVIVIVVFERKVLFSPLPFL